MQGPGTSPGDEGQKRQRAAHKKSNKGCGTCKERHVKCDERQPTCLRCQTAGRECKGYDAQPKKRKQTFAVRGFKMISFESPPLQEEETSPPANPPSNPEQTEEEMALEYFTTHTLSLLAHTHPSKLWNHSAADLLTTSPALHHIALALGAQHLRLVVSGVDPIWDDRAMRWYSSAVGFLREAISVAPPNTTVIALASLLCVLFESLLGRTSEMLIHLHNGLRYVFEDEVLRTREENRDIAAILSRLAIMCMLHNVSGAPARETQELMRGLRQKMNHLPEGSEMQNLHVEFTAIFEDTFEYLRALKYGFFEDQSSEILARMQLERRLEELLASIEARGRDCLPVESKDWEARKALVQSTSLMCWIYIKACHSGYQSSYEKYNRTFQKAVDLTELSLNYLNEHPDAAAMGGRLPFAFGLGHAATLCMAVHQCRVASIRRRALELFKKCPKRDGLWDADDRFKVMRAMADFEEQGADDYDENGMSLSVPEEFRIHHYDYYGPDEGGLAIVVFWKPRSGSEFVSKRIPVD